MNIMRRAKKEGNSIYMFLRFAYLHLHAEVSMICSKLLVFNMYVNMYRHACGDIIYFANFSDVCKLLNACFLIMCIFTSSKHAGVNLLCRKCRFLNSCIFDPCLRSSCFFDQIWSDQLSNDGHLLKVFGWFMLSLSTAPGEVKY